MLKSISFLILSFFSFRGFCQEVTPKVILSTPFSATNCYKSRVMQCRNGNTFLFNYKKNGCDFLLFDQDRKMIKRGPLTGRLAVAGVSNESYVSNLFETDTTLAFFLRQKIGGQLTMFRIVVSSTTGSIISEQKIAGLSKPKSGSGWAQMFGGVYADISVVQDEVSGSYAVISYDGFTEDTASKLRIDLYNPNHNQLWSNAYTKLAPEHKYLECLAVVVKQDRVLICTHEWTTRAHGAEESILVLSEIAAQDKIERQRKLDIEPGLKDVQVNLLYAPAAKRIMMCMTNRNGTFRQNYERYKISISAINEADFTVAYTKELNLNALDEYSRNACSKRKDFGGSFNNWILDEHGNPRLLLSEFLTATTSTTSAYSNLTMHINTQTEIGDIGIIQLDKDGNQTAGYVVAHAEVSNSFVKPGIMNRSEVLGTDFGEQKRFLYEDLASSEFSGCNYIHTPAKDYVIYNIDRKEITKSICDGIAGNQGNRSPAALYIIADGTQKRDYLFGAPGENEFFRSAVMKSSNYMARTNTYAVVMTEQHGRDMISRLAWIHL